MIRAILLILCVLGFANLSQAQTKEETIKWIKEKLEKYAFMENEVIKINECEIVIKRFVEGTNKNLWDEITLPTNPVSFSTFHFYFNSHIVKYLSSDTKKKDYKNSVDYVMNFSREDNLGERFLKALQHLNTFCEKKNETF